MPGRVLICGPNWLGDSIMSLPAVQQWSSQGESVTMLVKPSQVPLWRMARCVDHVYALNDGWRGIREAVGRVKADGPDAAAVFPNSFRSALVPFFAGVPVRSGFRGHSRAWMLNNVVKLPPAMRGRHQAWEYFCLLGLPLPENRAEQDSLVPALTVPEHARAAARKQFADTGWVGLLPGAARGPSKQWPADAFAAVGRKLVAEAGLRICVMGGARERGLCEEVAGAIGKEAMSLGGETSLEVFAALLGECRTVVTNDSGGMHLAAAVGTRVVAIYGRTDPTKTGPLGPGHRVLAASGEHDRDIPRDSKAAREALRSISVEQVTEAALEVLRETEPT